MKTLVIERMPKLFWELADKYSDIIEYLDYENFAENNTIEIIILRTHILADKSFIDKFKNLKLIIRAGSGFDNIDVKYAISKNIKVCNTPNANVQSAVEHTIGFIFSLIKKFKINEENLKNNIWKKNLKYNIEISDLRLLIVGVGRIGTRVAHIMQSLGAEVKGVDPYLTQDNFNKKHIVNTDYENGLKWCNIVSYHCPLTSETQNYFDENTLDIINHTFVINAARGKILSYDAIYKGLRNGKITGLAIDVFPNEPNINLDKKLDNNNVILSPHVGAFTQNAKARMAKETIHVWREFVENRNLVSEVDLRFI